MQNTKTVNLVLATMALVAVAIGAWLWSGGSTPSPAPLPKPVADNAAPSAAAGTPTAAPERSPALAPEATPIPRLATGVAPGAPLVRTTPAPKPPRPAVASIALPASQAIEPRTELEHVQSMIRDFRTRMGENPVGSNAEIMKAVMGGNPVGARLGPPEGQALNAEGELVDRWGTPYFFHQLGKDKMEIRSAGPDGKLWTPDDLVSR